MKVLLLTQVLPYPPDSGLKIKAWNVLKYLAQHHEVTLISFGRGGVAGSAPFYGRYQRFPYPKWAAKFYGNAFLTFQGIESVGCLTYIG